MQGDCCLAAHANATAPWTTLTIVDLNSLTVKDTTPLGADFGLFGSALNARQTTKL